MKKMLYSAKEVAEILSVGKSTVYGYAEKGIIKPVYLPSIKESKATKRNRRCVRFRVEEVDRFLRSLS